MKATIGAAAIGLILAGCSAGGSTSDSSSKPGVSKASDLIVTVDKSAINSSGSDNATITVTALDANHNVVPSTAVSISPDSGILTPSSTTTNTNGVLTAVLGVGSDHTNRNIDVVVTSGSIKKTLVVTVKGATLGATVGSGTSGSASTIQYTLLDASSGPIVGASITVSITGQPDVIGTTDANGKYAFPFVMPSTSTAVTAVGPGGVTVVNTVTPTNGSTVIPDAATVNSPSLSANPSSVATGHPVELRALFIGANNAPIPNVRMRFQMVDSNSIGGTLSSDGTDGTHNVVYSDANGVARTTYTGGTRGGVIIPKACWGTTDFAATACPNSMTSSSLTVVANGVSLAVLANGVLQQDDSKNIYSMSFIVQVVDASNQPISGSTVTGAVDIPRYYRGLYGIVSGKWVSGIFADSSLSLPLVPHESCDNEDINRNNVMEAGEDGNNSKALEPFKASVTIVPTSAGSNVTDAFGKAYFTLQYGQNYASWEDVVMTFTTSVEGTEGHEAYPSPLPVPSAALALITADPPFKVSPYNILPDGVFAPWKAGTTPVANPLVIYPSVANFNLCNAQH